MIRIIDYGLGNVGAFINVYKRLGLRAGRACNPVELEDADRIILPGVGAFDKAALLLKESGMRQKLDELVFQNKIPVLGVCVGMQLLASSSDEGTMNGLNWIPGRVRAFHSHPKSERLCAPHMGWNDIHGDTTNKLISGIEASSRFYFLHSFFYDCEDNDNIVAVTDYGFEFASIIADENIYGVQFHPEKSHHFGESLLKNFALL